MDCNELWDTLTGFRKARILHTALIWRFFNYVGEGATTEEIAHQAKTNQRGTERVLNALVGMGILKKFGEKYTHTELSETHLVENGNSSFAGVLHSVQSWESWGQLPQIVKSGELPERKRVFDDSERFRTFILAMHEYQKHRASEFVQKLPVQSGDAILDCGGGPGTYANAFAREYPDSNVTLLDLPDAIAIAKDLNSENLPVQYISGDFFKEDLGGPYDFVFLSNIIHSHSPARNRTLFRRIADVMESGGHFVIRDRFLDESQTEPLGAVIFGIHMLVNNLEGGTYIVREVQEWLQSTGFTNVEYRTIDDESEIVIAERAD